MAKSEPEFEYKGINHVALVSRDMAETVDFYTNVLEMDLVKTLDMNEHGQHFFFDCGSGETIAFFWFPVAPPVAPGIASLATDPRKDGIKTAHASMNHLAISIPPDKFDAYAERLRKKGIAIRITNHDDSPQHHSPEVNETTWVRSMYFDDPNGIHLELACFMRPFTDKDVADAPVNEQGEPVHLEHLKLHKA